ncbi:MAG: histidinol-phosphatase [Thermoanaerobaculia bacterium]
MITDYHTHTYRCGHAAGTLREYIDAAVARGIDEIGLTDHLWLYFEPPAKRNPTYAMSEEEYPRHYEEMVMLREEYRDRIRVRVSVEADYIEGRENDLLSILGRFEFDYILGSVHFMDGWVIDAPEYADRYRHERVAEIYRRYYRRLQQAIGLGCFDLLAHFDLPKKFGFLPEEDISALVGETLDVAAAAGVAIEISSAGLRKPIGEIYPARAILRQMHKRDIPIALSSDAHAPGEVGADYNKLIELATSEGYARLASFERRVRSFAPIGFVRPRASGLGPRT